MKPRFVLKCGLILLLERVGLKLTSGQTWDHKFICTYPPLSYSIQNFDSGKEVTVIRMLSDNVKYEILKIDAVMGPPGPGPHGPYFRHEKDDSKWNLCR